ncbi:apiosidase-like domain-containing protein [Chitinophaga sp. ARDCPP14]|uniref:apiosidase-like domain-containing protein n=1 Tax=Chitinophaga sp. ARDCPP14 TaxID=3391139 RepID=UPI003F51B7EE
MHKIAIIFFITLLSVTNAIHAQTGRITKLGISSNGRYFTTGGNAPFFWLGDTGWLLFNKLTREEAEKYLEDRRKKGFNVIQVMVVHNLEQVNAYGDSALINKNIATPHTTTGNAFTDTAQYDYWDHVDYIVGKAAEKGLYMALVPVWGSNVKAGQVSDQQARIYAAWLAARYKNKPNIIWLNGGDIKGSDGMEVWNAIGATLHAQDPGHLLTFHPRGRTQSSRWFHQASWLQFNMFQSGHRRYDQDTSAGDLHYGEDNWKYIEADYRQTPAKPTLDGEPSYEGIPQGLHDSLEARWNDKDVRRYGYWSVFAGAAGYTYGDNAVMQMHASKDKKGSYGVTDVWSDAINAPGAQQMVHLKNLLLSRPYFERVPDPSLIAGDAGDKYNRVMATRGKQYAFIYTYNGRNFRVNMGKIAGDTVKASWYDPRNGQVTLIGKFPNKGIASFDPPGTQQDGNDWVLILDTYVPGKKVYLFTSFREPATDGLRLLYSYDGYHWMSLGRSFLQPQVGEKKLMRDPSIVQGPDGTFHLVWTSGWKNEKGFGYASSKDLVHWSEQRAIDVMTHEPTTVNVWAPELFYDKEQQQFVIIWASTIPHRFPRGQEDEDNNHRMYYTATKDFKTFSPAKLFLDPGFSVIDATIVQQAAGKYALVLKDNTRPERNLKMAFSKHPTGPYTNVSAPFTSSFTEGPATVKVGSEWLIYFDAYGEKYYGAVKTKDFKTFTDISDQVQVPEGHKHGSIFQVTENILDVLQQPAADTVRYTGQTRVNVDYHHGQLSPAMGVHNIQVLRANREHPEKAEGTGYTYNHAPMLAYRNHTFYLEYLSDEVSESVAPGQTLLATSKDGYNWSKPAILFPLYKIPDGTTKQGYPGVAHNLYAVMHQRMGFYTSKKGRLLALAFYGICLDEDDRPNDGQGIGRVVREILPDGSFGPIYFIRYNAAWNEKNTSYPHYSASPDKDFVAACNELLADPLVTQQWNEEADRNDPLIPLKKQYKALSYYHLPDGRVVGLWKNALTAISNDGGKTWPESAVRAPGFVNANAKIWGQRTADGRYATVYNPSEYRWPLAISVSNNGLDYTNMLLVQGEISPLRYKGYFKDYGPQYVRGITENNGTPPGGNMWITYSMNKEDIWVARIPVPVTDKATAPVNDVFKQMLPDTALQQWNIYSPAWAPVKMEQSANGPVLALKDGDPYDYAKAERLFPETQRVVVEFSITPAQNNRGLLHAELQDTKGNPCVRLMFEADSTLKAKAGAKFKNILKYQAGATYNIRITLNTATRFYTVNINGKDVLTQLTFAPVQSVARMVFRTGMPRHTPDADTPAEQTFDLPHGGEPEQPAIFYIGSLKTTDPNHS